MFLTESVGTSMIYLHEHIWMPSSNGSLRIRIKPTAKDKHF